MTTWWNKNIPGKRLQEFESWIKEGVQSDRIYCRKYIAEKNYKSFLDCGCGLAVDYYGFKEDNYPIKYVGLDSCYYLIDLHRANDIQIIEAELDKPLPIRDDTYECVYGREIMEHLQYHRRTLDEFIRVASKEVIITWFIKPDNEPEDIKYREDEDVFHNKYNIDQLEKFILSNDKVESVSWHAPNEKHAVLHIKMKPMKLKLTVEERDGAAAKTAEVAAEAEKLFNEELSKKKELDASLEENSTSDNSQSAEK